MIFFPLALDISYLLFAYRHKQINFSILFGEVFCVIFAVWVVCGGEAQSWMENQYYLFIPFALLPFVQFIVSISIYGFSQFFFWWFLVATLDLLWLGFIDADGESLAFQPIIAGVYGVPLMLFATALYLSLKKVRFPKIIGGLFACSLIEFTLVILQMWLDLSWKIEILACLLIPFAFFSFVLFYVGILFVLVLSFSA